MLALLLCASFVVSHAEANAGPPFYTGGQVAAEPSGLEGITISHEALDIDMRRLPSTPGSAR